MMGDTPAYWVASLGALPADPMRRAAVIAEAAIRLALLDSHGSTIPLRAAFDALQVALA